MLTSAVARALWGILEGFAAGASIHLDWVRTRVSSAQENHV